MRLYNQRIDLGIHQAELKFAGCSLHYYRSLLLLREDFLPETSVIRISVV